MDTGLIHIYCGDGKGKTTAAVGLTIRCIGRGGRVVFAQFLKTRETGELAVLQQLDAVTVMRSEGPSKFTFQMTPDELEDTKRRQQALFHEIVEQCRLEQPDMLVLDEALPACRLGLLPEDELLSFLRTRPNALEIVLTGRDPSERLLALADYVSEIRKRKHPYDQGIAARAGIEE